MTHRVSRRGFFRGAIEPPATPAEFLVRVHRRMMACRVEVVLPGESASFLPLASAALDEGDRLEQIMTIFRDDSELSRVNREARDRPVEISCELLAVLQRARELSDATGGAFDVTSAPLSRVWGFLGRAGRLPGLEEIEEARRSVGIHLVETDPSARTVAFRAAGVSLNLGSIGKGFALDGMSAWLAARGVADALLSAGASSLRALQGGTTSWTVDLRTATSGERLATLHLSDAAVGTSGSGEQYFEIAGTRYGHVIDPRTGWPAAGVLSASVIAADAATADALSTAFLIGGIDLAKRYCDRHAETVAIITPEHGSRTPVVIGHRKGVRVELA